MHRERGTQPALQGLHFDVEDETRNDFLRRVLSPLRHLSILDLSEWQDIGSGMSCIRPMTNLTKLVLYDVHNLWNCTDAIASLPNLMYVYGCATAINLNIMQVPGRFAKRPHHGHVSEASNSAAQNHHQPSAPQVPGYLGNQPYLASIRSGPPFQGVSSLLFTRSITYRELKVILQHGHHSLRYSRTSLLNCTVGVPRRVQLRQRVPLPDHSSEEGTDVFRRNVDCITCELGVRRLRGRSDSAGSRGVQDATRGHGHRAQRVLPVVPLRQQSGWFPSTLQLEKPDSSRDTRLARDCFRRDTWKRCIWCWTPSTCTCPTATYRSRVVLPCSTSFVTSI